MRFLHLAIGVLQERGVAAVQHAGTPVADRRGVLAEPAAAPPGLEAEQGHARITDECAKEADRVRSAADAGDRRVRQQARRRLDLLPRFLADDRLQLAHDPGVGVWPDGRAEAVVGTLR